MKYNLILDSGEVSVEEYLQNKEVYVVKEIVNDSLSTILKQKTVINITKIEVEEIRENCHCLELYYQSINNLHSYIRIYINGGDYALQSFVKQNLIPVSILYNHFKK
jgi:hypothetical protein